MVKPGDIVRYLNSVGGGVVTKVVGNMAYVDDEGFETPVLIRECVVVGQAAPKAESNHYATSAKDKTVASKEATVATFGMPKVVEEPKLEIPVEETPEGEKLNVVLAYEAEDVKKLSTCGIDAYLVNDSNYYLSFVYMSRANDSEQWICRYAGVVEPNIQLLLGEVKREDLVDMDRVCIQYVAYKSDKPFAMKVPAVVERSLDTTKFFKLHCFRSNVYFDKPVIAIDVVKDDVPQNKPEAVVVDTKALEESLKAKKRVDERRRPVKKRAVEPKSKGDGMIVVDLHIDELIDNTRGLSSADMLNLQVDEFRRVMDENLKHKGTKIVFIHGKGEGVLRQALMKELSHRYKGHDVQDASFREYGFGATQVTIR